MAKTDDDNPDRVRPSQRGNDERRIGQEKKLFIVIHLSDQIMTIKYAFFLCA